MSVVGIGAKRFGNAALEQRGRHADGAGGGSELAQVAIDDFECADFAAVGSGGFGEGECCLLVERVEKETACGETFDDGPVAAILLGGDHGDEHAAQARRDHLALALEPLAERCGEARRVSGKKRALHQFGDALWIGAASRGEDLPEIGLGRTRGQNDVAAIGAQRGAERVEPIERLSEAVIRALGGCVRP